MFGKTIKSFLVILFLLFVFIDAANIADLFSDTEVVHYKEGNPDSLDYVSYGAAVYQLASNSFQNLSSKTYFGSHTKKKLSPPKLLIFDQDSPSVVHDIQADEKSISSIAPSDYTVPSDQTVSRVIYIEDCRLQI